MSGSFRARRAFPEEPELVRRSLLWLLSFFPALHEQLSGFIGGLLPTEFREAWTVMRADRASEDEWNLYLDFESWVLEGYGGYGKL